MNKEELIGKLQMVYVGDRNALNEMIDYYDGLKEVIEILKQENQKYKEAIDKLNDLLIIKKARCLNEDNYVLNVPDLDDILQVLKEVE